MRKLISFTLFVCLVHACASTYYEKSTPPPSVKLSDDYESKNAITATRQKLVTNAEQLVGSKYKYGGKNPNGFDCSGLTGYVYGKINKNITGSSASQAKLGKQVKTKDTKPGDLVFFTGTGKNKISHVAMVVSNDSKGVVVIHSTTSRGVIKENISKSTYWKPKVLFSRRIVD